MKKHELLAPAGSLEICKAVIAAGADAVYLGGEKYGARAFAQNFSRGEVLEALDFAHLYGRKIFLTVNTLLKNREQGAALFSYIKPYYERGLDAVIVQDYGVFQFLKKNFPDLPLHVSTQASVSNVYGAKFFLEQGAARIVPSRELSLSEIRRIYEETGARLECFIHGALCYSYSGQCLMSSLLGGRSGNRGRCAQPCRLAYEVVDADGNVCHKKEKYPLSPKDLNALEILPKLCEAGIYSFKIEGRMKSLEYAAGVTGVYRHYLDLYERTAGNGDLQSDPGLADDARRMETYAVAKEDLQYLFDLGNRSGFTKGYYEMRSGRAMMTLTDSSHTSADAKEVYRPAVLEKVPVSGKVEMRAGEPMQLELFLCGRKNSGDDRQSLNRKFPPEGLEKESRIAVEGAAVSAAQNRPLSADDVRARFSKTGDTPFEVRDLDVVLDGDCFVPVGQMNELRRQGLALLQEKLLASYRRKIQGNDVPDTCVCKDVADREKAGHIFARQKKSGIMDLENDSMIPGLDVWVSNPSQLDTVLSFPFVDMVTLDFSDALEDYREKITSAGKRAAFAMPHVFRENSSEIFDCGEFWEILSQFDMIWVRTYDELGFFLQGMARKPQKAALSPQNEAENEQHYLIPPEKMALDDHLYIFSEESAAAFLALGVNRYTASPELNRKELKHLPNARAEFPIYGYAPMMISAQCVYKNYFGCTKQTGEITDSKKEKNLATNTELFLRDRYLKKFFIYRNCANCYNVIYNSQPLYLLHQADEVKKLGFGAYRISFTRENADDVRRILEDYRRAFLAGERVKPSGDDFTTGHFKRGVE